VAQIGDLRDVWVAAERLNQFRAIHPQLRLIHRSFRPANLCERRVDPVDALVEVVRGRLEGLGPVTFLALAESFSLPANQIEIALAKLEGEGFAMQGQFTPGGTQASSPAATRTGRVTEWCSRRLLRANSSLHS
jgi:ATP-dependent Lhr-like helicase